MSWLEKLLGESQLNLLRLLRRSRLTITALAARLGLTDNAVRTHISALSRNGLVEERGSQRDTGGKPARLYDLTRGGEELFPKAYAPILSGLIAEIESMDGPGHAQDLLRSLGQRVGRAKPHAGTPAERVAEAAEALRDLGGDIDVIATEHGWRLQGYGCPLSAVTAKDPRVCVLAQELVSEVAGQPVLERCDHTGRPRCAFVIENPVPVH